MCLVCTASLCDGRLCHVQLILTYDISCVSLSDHMKLVYNVLAPLLCVFGFLTGDGCLDEFFDEI